jgi:hypothetical protein
MKVQIRDRDALSSLTTSGLRSYLQSRGWSDAGLWGERATIHVKEHGGRDWEILIPLRDTVADYAGVMAEAVAVLATVEERPELAVFDDLAGGSGDSKIASLNRQEDSSTVRVWCVRTDHGKYTDHLVSGDYVGYGGNWPDFSDAKDLNEIKERLAQMVFQDETSKRKIAAYAGMMATFLWKIQPGDWLITPYGKDTPRGANQNGLRYGQALTGSCWYTPVGTDICPYTMRRKIAWADQTLHRDSLSKPLRRTIVNTSKSVFHVKQRADFLASIGLRDAAPANG